MHVTAKSMVSFRHGWIQGSKGSASFCGVVILWLFQANILSCQQREISSAQCSNKNFRSGPHWL